MEVFSGFLMSSLPKGLQEGENKFKDGKVIEIEKLLTFKSGFCYLIRAKEFPKSEELSFTLSLNPFLAKEDWPLAEIYLTSIENAFGVVSMNWHNGDELKFKLDGTINEFKLRSIQHKYLEQSATHCSKNQHAFNK